MTKNTFLLYVTSLLNKCILYAIVAPQFTMDSTLRSLTHLLHSQPAESVRLNSAA